MEKNGSHYGTLSIPSMDIMELWKMVWHVAPRAYEIHNVTFFFFFYLRESY
jgi:hypothetical protein